jgi:repressor LexA
MNSILQRFDIIYHMQAMCQKFSLDWGAKTAEIFIFGQTNVRKRTLQRFFNEFFLLTNTLFGIILSMVNKMVNTLRRELTPRQESILKAVGAFILEHGYGPTIRRLGSLLQIPSPSAVFKHVASLERKGYLRRERGELRIAGAPTAVEAHVRVPLAGLVSAGVPREAFEASGEALDIPDWMIGRRRSNVFCIRVEGKSMIDAFIDDGDHVLLERTNSVVSGEMIVARLEDGSVTLKRIRRENGRTILVPENPAYQPFEVENLLVLGRVIGILRKY